MSSGAGSKGCPALLVELSGFSSLNVALLWLGVELGISSVGLWSHRICHHLALPSSNPGTSGLCSIVCEMKPLSAAHRL